MKIKILIFLGFLCFFSCQKKVENKEKLVKTSYKITIYDTLEVEAIAPSLRIIDYSKTRILFSDLMGQELIQTNLKGKFIEKFRLIGDNPQQVGAYMYGATYLGDTAIASIGTNGLFLYDLSGKLKSTYSKKISTIRGGTLARRYKLIDLHINKNPYIIGTWFSPFKDEEKSLVSKDINIYRRLKFLTIFNLETQKYYIDLPFEKNSIFQKNENRYDDAYCFDYNRVDGLLYSLISPDKNINIYQVTDTGLVLKESILLETQDFELRKVGSFGSPIDPMEIYVNSEFRTLDVSQDGKYCLVSYRTGIPVEEYKRAKSNAEIPQIHKEFNKRYVILLENKKQVSAPIQLPKDVKEVIFFKSLDYVLLSTDSFENPDKTSFYVARLEKIR